MKREHQKAMQWHDDPNITDLNNGCLEEALDFLNSAVSRTGAGGAILVYCIAGRSRSVAVIIAWLNARCALSVAQALDCVRELRPWVEPKAGFLTQLHAFAQKSDDARIIKSALLSNITKNSLSQW